MNAQWLDAFDSITQYGSTVYGGMVVNLRNS